MNGTIDTMSCAGEWHSLASVWRIQPMLLSDAPPSEFYPNRCPSGLVITSFGLQYTCVFCGKDSVKRKAAGIWTCGGCNKTQTGGAYQLAYVKPIVHMD
jgi:hypothetical protein